MLSEPCHLVDFLQKTPAWQNITLYIQYVAVLFMFLAGTNFTLHYLMLRGRVKKAISGIEFRTYLLVLIIPSILIAIALACSKEIHAEQAWRAALFNVVSIVTCTGFCQRRLYALAELCLVSDLPADVCRRDGRIYFGRYKDCPSCNSFKNVSMILKKLRHKSAVIPIRLDNKPVLP